MAEAEKSSITMEKSRDVEAASANVAGEVSELDVKSKAGNLHADVGLALYQQSLQYDPAQLERDAVKVRRKLDFIVLPMMMCTYMLSFLDKQTLNYSNAYGMQADTHMHGQDFSWVASALYFGWLCGAWPSNLALQRFPIGKLIGCICFVWGGICMLQATVFNFPGFVAVRFFLGFTESCISPAWVILTSMLWTREEQTLRTNMWIGTNGVSSILGSLISWGLGHSDKSAVASWKLIFLVVGAATFLWGFVVFFFLPDGPHNARILSEYERVVAVWRVSRNHTGVKQVKFKPYQVKEALLDPKTWILMLMAAALGMLNASVTTFMTPLIKGFGFSPLKTTLLQMPGGAVAVVACIMLGFLSTYKNMIGVVIILGCIPGIAGLAGIMTISTEHRYNLVACAWIQNFLGSPVVTNWNLPALNVAGHTKRTMVVGMYFIFFCAGNIAGPQYFFADEAPRYFSAIKALETCYAAVVVLQVVYTTTCWMQNKDRDSKGFHALEEQEALEGFDDMTDLENKHFRYKL